MKRKNRICLLLCTALLLVQFASAVYAGDAVSEGYAQDTASEMLADPELAEKELLPYEAALIDISGVVKSVVEALKKKDNSTYISKFKTEFETILAIIKDLKEKGLVSSKIARVKEIVDSLVPDLKGLIADYLIQKALDKIEKVKKAAEVIEMIAAIPLDKITSGAKEKIQAAAAAFKSLKDESKSYIGDEIKKKLEVAKELLAVKEAMEKKADQSVAVHLENAINSILTSDVIQSDTAVNYKTEIQAISNVYNSMTDEQKDKVDHTAVKKLADAEGKVKTKQEATKSNEAESPRLKNKLEKTLLVSRKKTKATVSWGLVPGAGKYEVYAEYIGRNKFEKVAVTSGSGSVCKVTFSKLHGKKLNRKKGLKVYVVAYRYNLPAAKSIKIYAAGTKSKRYGDAAKVRTDKKTYKISKGKSKKIKAKAVCRKGKKQIKGQCKAVRFVSLNPSVAKVDARGKVKGLKKGSCIVRVFAKNGRSKDVKVVVK